MQPFMPSTLDGCATDLHQHALRRLGSSHVPPLPARALPEMGGHVAWLLILAAFHQQGTCVAVVEVHTLIVSHRTSLPSMRFPSVNFLLSSSELFNPLQYIVDVGWRAHDSDAQSSEMGSRARRLISRRLA
jgi:hypothetical protein